MFSIVKSLIDLAGSEKAAGDEEHMKECKYISTRTPARNAARGKYDHIPYRNSKLTPMLQPLLAGDAQVSVICAIGLDVGVVAESASILLFARRVKGVKVDESRVMEDPKMRIQPPMKLILASQSVKAMGDKLRPTSPVKINFGSHCIRYVLLLQRGPLSAWLQIEFQATRILSLEALFLSWPPQPTAPDVEKGTLIARQAQTIRELKIAVHGRENNLSKPLRAVRRDVGRDYTPVASVKFPLVTQASLDYAPDTPQPGLHRLRPASTAETAPALGLCSSQHPDPVVSGISALALKHTSPRTHIGLESSD
ncbi:hypothetical protein BD779DRAFT_1471303 [Infundibulicybe gibba]|nr:hypothetical protein BD779DRAFT_1471303 [Infundibulicybe gibba]